MKLSEIPPEEIPVLTQKYPTLPLALNLIKLTGYDYDIEKDEVVPYV